MLPYVKEEESVVEEIPVKQKTVVKWHDKVLLNRPSKVVLALLLGAVLAPLLIYNYVFITSLEVPPSDGHSTGSCLLSRPLRLYCGLGAINESECHPQCCYDQSNNMCFHRFPSRFSYHTPLPWSEDVILHTRVPTVPFKFQNSVPRIRISVNEISRTHMSINFYDARQTMLEGQRIDDKDYVYHISSNETNVEVNGTYGTIFNTRRGPLIASENIWEIAFRLTEESMYGLGEIPLEEGAVKVIYSYSRGLNSIPLIFAKSNGSYHGLLIDVKAPTEVRVLGENNVMVRSINSQGLKFHLFVGPEPADVMRDVMKFTGFNVKLEYWMLGAHICNEVSDSPASAYDELTDFLEKASKLPFESHCGTAPVVFDDRCDVQNEYVEEGAKLLVDHKKRFMPHVSPFIRYEGINETSNNSMEIRTDKSCWNLMPEFEEFMLRAQSNQTYEGVAGGGVIYPDYENATEEFMRKLWKYEIRPDGWVLENNWPLDTSYKTHNETYEILPYFNEYFKDAFNHTPEWSITRPNGELYMYTHNQYGNNFANAFKRIYEDIPVWTSSQWMNGGVIVNRQNINATWTNLHRELIQAALGGVSGHWFWNSPVCGDTEHFDPELQINLCVKWYMAATFLPMLKIHSKSVPRHPLSFVGTNRRLMTTALNNRLSFLPYFFTTLQDGPLLRPMFYQFPSSNDISHVQSQFSVGDALLIVPNLHPSQSHVHIWLPPGTWYEYWSGLQLEGEEGEAVTMTTTDADFLMLIRGGFVVVTQKDVKQTAEETRLTSDYSLTIALECETTNTTDIYFEIVFTTECKSHGSLYISKDMTIIFEATARELNITSQGEDFSSICDENTALSAKRINEIKVYGMEEDYNNYDHHTFFETDIDLCKLQTSKEIIIPLLKSV